MIEFKADCGHTVRARDEDGGGVVRCSYCGKPAPVPENNADDLDFLFTDVEQDGTDGKPGKKRRGRTARAPKRKKAPGEFNRGIGDRVVHVLLVMGMIREQEVSQDE